MANPFLTTRIPQGGKGDDSWHCWVTIQSPSAIRRQARYGHRMRTVRRLRPTGTTLPHPARWRVPQAHRYSMPAAPKPWSDVTSVGRAKNRQHDEGNDQVCGGCFQHRTRDDEPCWLSSRSLACITRLHDRLVSRRLRCAGGPRLSETRCGTLGTCKSSSTSREPPCRRRRKY